MSDSENPNPLARLKHLLLSLFEGTEEEEKLKWILRDIHGGSVHEQLEQYITLEEPAPILRRLVLDDLTKLRQCLARLRAVHFRLPTDPTDERHFLEKILWKLEFFPTRFDSPLQSFYAKVENLRRAASATSYGSEEWKDNLRSYGVNVFVSLEEVLDMGLSFASWMFLTDHFSEKHRYNLRRARTVMAAHLNGRASTKEGPILYDSAGKNTLYPLIVGFSTLRDYLLNILETEGQQSLKREDGLPHFANKTSLQLFPYRHTKFIFDCPQEDRVAALQALGEVSQRLQEINVSSLRNRIEHRSDPFPTKDEVLRGCDVVTSTVESLEKIGLIPIVFATDQTEFDAFGRRRVISRDYNDRKWEWKPSPSLKGIPSLPPLRRPQILVLGLHVPGTGEIVRFAVEEDSDYTNMWKDYPKRRPLERQGTTEATQQDTLPPSGSEEAAVPSQKDDTDGVPRL